MKRIIALSISACLLLSSLGGVYAESNVTHLRAPIETTKNGILYLDGIPVEETKHDTYLLKTKEDKNELNTKYSLFSLAKSIAYPYNQWSKKTNSFVYKGRDRDGFSNRSNDPVSVTLTTTSETTYSVSGSTKFGFEGIAEVDMGVSLGKTWGKTYELDFTVKSMTRKELQSACKVRKTKWIYPEKVDGTTKNYYAYTYNKYSNEKWVYEEDL